MRVYVCVLISETPNSQSGFCTASVNIVRDRRGAAAGEIIISISYHLTGVLYLQLLSANKHRHIYTTTTPPGQLHCQSCAGLCTLAGQF